MNYPNRERESKMTTFKSQPFLTAMSLEERLQEGFLRESDPHFRFRTKRA